MCNRIKSAQQIRYAKQLADVLFYIAQVHGSLLKQSLDICTGKHYKNTEVELFAVWSEATVKVISIL